MKTLQRYALVTGASSDVGAAIALDLAATGHSLWLTYFNNRDAVDATAANCAEMGVDVRVSPLDLRSLESIHALEVELTAEWGRLDILINNAAASSFIADEDLSTDGWDYVFAVNARGTFLISKSMLPLLQTRSSESDDKNIVNVAGISGQVGALRAGTHYAASKAAVLAITRSQARSLAPVRIRVNAVSPGPLDTSMVAHVPTERKQALGAALPVGRFGTPTEVAWVVAMLTSPRASFVTGATYDVNGGARID